MRSCSRLSKGCIPYCAIRDCAYVSLQERRNLIFSETRQILIFFQVLISASTNISSTWNRTYHIQLERILDTRISNITEEKLLVSEGAITVTNFHLNESGQWGNRCGWLKNSIAWLDALRYTVQKSEIIFALHSSETACFSSSSYFASPIWHSVLPSAIRRVSLAQ